MNIKLNRYSSFSRFHNNEIVETEIVCNTDFGDSITDDSYYVPNSEAVKRIRAMQGLALSTALYDDVKDLKNPDKIDIFARQKGRDMAEVSTHINNLQVSLDKNLKKDMDNYKNKLKAEQDRVVLEKAKALASVNSNSDTKD